MNQNTNWQKLDESGKSIKLGSPSAKITSGLRYRLDKVYKLVDFSNKKILDIGCGVGAFLEEFLKFSKEVYGSEIDERKVEMAKKNVPKAHIKLVKDENLPFEDNFFDILFCHEVLEHTDNDSKLISEAARVLKPDGKFILFIPNKWYPFETHGMYIKEKYKFGNIPLLSWAPEFIRRKFAPHVKIYSASNIRKKLKENNLKIDYHGYVYPGLSGLGTKYKFAKNLAQKLHKLEETPFKKFGISHMIIASKYRQTKLKSRL